MAEEKNNTDDRKPASPELQRGEQTTDDSLSEENKSGDAPYSQDDNIKLENTEIDNKDQSSDDKTLEEKYKRALADYQNLVKQTAKEKMEFAKYANELLLTEMLPVYDHLKIALRHAKNTPNNAKDIIEGV